MPRHVYTHGDFVFDGHGEEGWRLDFEIAERGRHDAADVVSCPGDRLLKRDVRVVSGVSSELHFKIAVEHGLAERGLRHAEAHGNEGILSATGDLDHVNVAIGIA